MNAQGGIRLTRGGAAIGVLANRSTPAFAAVGRAPRPTLRQALVVLGLLAGLLGMHGFSVDHAMAQPVGAATAMTTPDGPAAAARHGLAVEPVTASAQVTGLAAGHTVPNQPMDMGAACLAVLAVALLVLVLLGPGRIRRGLEIAAALRRRWSTYQGLAPPRPPDLHLLCVLRT